MQFPAHALIETDLLPDIAKGKINRITPGLPIRIADTLDTSAFTSDQ